MSRAQMKADDDNIDPGPPNESNKSDEARQTEAAITLQRAWRKRPSSKSNPLNASTRWEDAAIHAKLNVHIIDILLSLI